MFHSIGRLVPAVFLAATIHSSALTINLTYDTRGQAGSVPTGDSNGALLMAVCRAAADRWEDIIQDTHTLQLQVRYDNSITGIGKWTESAESEGRATSGAVSFKGTTTWYYDQTPTNHDEYNLQQTLVRDLSTRIFNQTYAGTPPPLLEYSFTGTLAAGAPAAAMNATDLLSVALHEISHALGMSAQLSTCASEISDGDFDIAPNLVNGANFDVIVTSTGGAHTACPQCLMNPGIPQQLRRLPGATDVLALATCPNPGWVSIDLPRQDFLPGGTTDWHTPGNWVGNAIPGALDDASVRIGKQTGVVSGVNIELSANAPCNNLFLGESTDLVTNGFKLDVVDTATLEYDGAGARPQLFVESGGELEATNLLLNGGKLDMTGGLADINDDLVLSPDTNGLIGEISGFGIVDVAGRLVNDGRITATDLVTNTLSFVSSTSNPWDLDGLDGDGEVLATSGNLNFSSGAITDSFDGVMRINDPFTLNFGEGWILGSGGKVDLNGGDAQFANLTGGLITASGGSFECSLKCLVTAPVNFSGSFSLNILGSGELEMDSFTTYNGGTYTLGNRALFELDGVSVFEAGSFNLTTDSILRTDGVTTIKGGSFNIGTGAVLDLNGTHSLRAGSFIGNGTLRFNGRTNINEAVMVDCGILDLDGGGLLGKQINLNADLIVNSNSLDSSGSANTFNSTLNFGPNAGLSSAELRVLSPATWTMAGVMNTNTESTFTLPSVSGVPFTMSGVTNVIDSTRWDAIATITGTVNIPESIDKLGLSAGTAASPNRIRGGSIMGLGTLRATGTSNLVGFGAISANIDFLGADSPGGAETRLLADDGTLTLSGAFTNVPQEIGTADDDGILQITNAWTLTGNDTLSLAGGSVTGGVITNQGVIHGDGRIGSSGLNNDGEISARNGKLLTIDTAGPCDLDGFDGAPNLAEHRLNAIDGNLSVLSTLLEPFDGTATIGAGRSMTFVSGWGLGINGVLNMNGGSNPGNEAALLGLSALFYNVLNVDGEARIGSAAIFAFGTEVNLNDSATTLRLSGNSDLHAGASFSGPGKVVAAPGSTVGLANAANVNVAFVNESSVVISSSPGRAAVRSYTQSAAGRLSLVLADRPAGPGWDAITVNGAASLAGRLSILFNVPGAQLGDTWKIIAANSLAGNFTDFQVIGLPPGLSLAKTEANDGVYLELVSGTTYLDWAIAEGIPVDARAIDDDPDMDFVDNGLELLLGGDPNSPDPGLLPIPEPLDLEGSTYLTLTVMLANEVVPTDLTLRVTRSTDAINWSSANVVLHQSSVDPISGVETRVYRSTLPFATLADEFLRIEAGP